MVVDNKFAFSPGQMGKLINPKNMPALKALGGIEGIEKGLRTDIRAGLSVDETILDGVVSFQDATGGIDRNAVTPDFAAPQHTATGEDHVGVKHHNDSFKDRLRVFKDNRLPERKSKSLLQLMWIALMDKVLLLLSAAAVISLALGLYQTFGVAHEPGTAKVDWVEGVAIIVAIVIVVVVGAGNDYQKERQFIKLNKKVSCVRSRTLHFLIILRKKIASSRSYAPESPSRSRSMTSWLATWFTWSPETLSPQTEFSSPVTMSSATSLLQLVSRIR